MDGKQFSGSKLRQERRARGLSRTELGAAIERSYDTIATWERDQFSPSLASFIALIGALGCEPNDLVTENAPAGRQARPTTNASVGTRRAES